jgi:hypothetical protein
VSFFIVAVIFVLYLASGVPVSRIVLRLRASRLSAKVVAEP